MNFLYFFFLSLTVGFLMFPDSISTFPISNPKQPTQVLVNVVLLELIDNCSEPDTIAVVSMNCPSLNLTQSQIFDISRTNISNRPYQLLHTIPNKPYRTITNDPALQSRLNDFTAYFIRNLFTPHPH